MRLLISTIDYVLSIIAVVMILTMDLSMYNVPELAVFIAISCMFLMLHV